VKDHPIVSGCKAGLRLLFRVFFRIGYLGLENIPPEGPCLIVPNHQSYLDPLFVGAALPRSNRYMAMQTLFRSRPLAAFLRFFGAFPVATGSADKSAIRDSIRFLRQGELVIIFPEGGRSRDGNLKEFFQGFARIALREKIPIVPVTISGAHKVWPPGKLVPRPGRIRVTFHPPLHPRESAGREEPAMQVVQTVRDRIASGFQG
jgi:1-acyl-sn-glycerol-3-phosphate acyltransferase